MLENIWENYMLSPIVAQGHVKGEMSFTLGSIVTNLPPLIRETLIIPYFHLKAYMIETK